jgi:hypothetical protein
MYLPTYVFWDLENCQIPAGKSTADVVAALNYFVHEECGHENWIEKLTVVAAKMEPEFLQELCKGATGTLEIVTNFKGGRGAADKILIDRMTKLPLEARREYDSTLHYDFDDELKYVVILISGDGDFKTTMRMFQQLEEVDMRVVVSHAANCDQALRSEADRWMDWNQFCELHYTEEEKIYHMREYLSMVTGDPLYGLARHAPSDCGFLHRSR